MTHTIFRFFIPAFVFVAALLVGAGVSSVAFAATSNGLILNGSFEEGTSAPTGWSQGGWGELTAEYSYPAVGVADSRAASVSVSALTTGDAKWVFDHVAVTAGETYTYTDTYQATVPTTLVAEYKRADAPLEYVWLADVPAAANWTTVSKDFTIPAGVVSVSVFHVLAADGTLTIDDVALAQTTTPAPTPTPEPTPTPLPIAAATSLQNGSFELGATNAPTYWSQGGWGALTAVYTYPVVGVAASKAAEVRISSRTNGDAKWVFDHVAVDDGQTYTYTDTYKASVPTTIEAEYKHADGALEYVWLADAAAASTWTPVTTEFVVPAGVVSVSVFHVLAAVGTLTIDDVTLTKNAPVLPGTPMVSITFDDAWKTQYTKALPILTKYNMKGTFYITTQYFNTTLYTGFMTRANVKDLYAKGHEIGSHSVSHPNLATITLTKLRAELNNSKATLTTLLGKPVTGLAYPFGEFNQTVIDEAKKLGYTHGRTINEGLNTKTTDPFRLYAISPTSATPLAEVKAAIDQAKTEGKWLNIAFHEINTSGNEYSNTPAYFEEVLKYIQASNVEVVTVEQGLARR